MSNNKEYDYLFKIVIIGASGVGKSSLLNRFSDDSFNDSYLATIGVDFKFKTILIDGKKVKMQIWDTAGQERFRTITNAYYKGADAIILVYDTTNLTSFNEVEKFWMNEIENYAEKDALLMLLGNKSDLTDKKAISFDRANRFAKIKEMGFYETSAKTSDFVEIAFESIGKRLVFKKDEQISKKKLEYRSRKKEERVKDKESNSLESKVRLNEEKYQKLREKVQNYKCSC